MEDICFANAGDKTCTALRNKTCHGEGCVFFQTKEQYEASYKKVFIRLASLDYVTQMYIADKYYGGKKRWKHKTGEVMK